jgi:hypothetical protein
VNGNKGLQYEDYIGEILEKRGLFPARLRRGLRGNDAGFIHDGKD